MLDTSTPITVAGAGSIGCYVGGCLALAGRRVTLLGRAPLMRAVTARGLDVADIDGTRRTASIKATDDPVRALSGAGIVLVAVKSGQTAEMADLIAACAPPQAVVVSLQNGVDNPAILRSRLARTHPVAAGMVPFNVVQTVPLSAAPVFQRTTEGSIAVDAAIPELADVLNVAGLPTQTATDMDAVLWGKLILNLNNALNALSGLTLVEELSDRRWRRLLAGQMTEALAAMRAAGIRPATIGRLKPSILPFVLKLPDAVFRITARRMLAIDEAARSSMWEDLERHRRTEIGQFQGAVIRLAAAHGLAAPVSQAVMERVLAAEEAKAGSPGLSPETIALP